MDEDVALLRLAAKAAGMKVILIPYGIWRDVTGFRPEQNVLAAKEWNPLVDDGDALRLAVKLGMRLEIDNHWNRTHAKQIPKGEWRTAPHDSDPYAATRRAIVLAAAEIGKEME
jgi:hypothetical protein